MSSKFSSASGFPGWLLLLAAITAVAPLSIDLYLPGFVMIEHTFAQHGVERTLASYLAGTSIGQLFYGPISDRFGRKPPLYAGFALYTLGTIGCALAGSLNSLIVFRFIQAAGGSSGVVIARAIVRDRCEPEDAARAFSTLLSIVAVTPILAPLAGGWIVMAVGWRATFWIQGVFGVGIAIAAHLLLTETHDTRHAAPLRLRSTLLTYTNLLRDKNFISYALMCTIVMGALFLYVAGAPALLLRLYGVTPQDLGWVMALNGVGFMIAGRINMHVLRKHSPAFVLSRVIWGPVVLGGLLMIVALVGKPSLPLLLTVQFGFVLAAGLLNPNVAALALAHHGRNAGSASALLGCLQSMGTTVAGIVTSLLHNDSVRPLSFAMGGCAAIMLLIHLRTRSAARLTAR